jgi:hypothetical protein
MMPRSVRVRHGTLVLLFLMVALLGCQPSQRDTRFDEATAKTGPAVVKEAVPGDKLNAYFPKDEGDWDVVYTQEKQGQSQAELKKSGKAVATLAIFDTLSNKEAADEFKDAKDKFNNKYPMVAKGKLGTAILVGDRFQVQVRTAPGADFSEDDRKTWLGKFQLGGLETLQ